MNNPKKSILIVLIAGIGDLILASKSIRTIRNGFPNASIHLLTNSEAVTLARNYPYVDYVWAFPIRQMRRRKTYIFNVLKRMLQLRKIEFEMAVNLFEVGSWLGAIKMGFIFFLINARIKIGHNNKGFGLFLTKKTPPGIFKCRHRVEAMMDIAHLGGGLPDEGGIDIFWDKQCEKKWDYLFEKTSPRLNEIIVGINPGGDWQSKRWSTDNFAIVADKIIEEFNSKIILLGGPGEEDIGREIQQRMKNDAVNLSGKLELNDLAYIISRFDLLITNDSGPMHIGTATRTPLVAIFGPGDPELVRPYTSQRLNRVVYKGLDCQPCNNRKCSRPFCLDLIKPFEVYETCVELLKVNKSLPSKFKKR
jgi:lipopolysaccharide heptosyltransferase II